jgi:hypothetical protein
VYKGTLNRPGRTPTVEPDTVRAEPGVSGEHTASLGGVETTSTATIATSPPPAVAMERAF